MLKKHEMSNAHKFSASKYKGWLDSQKTGTVSSKISEQLGQEIERNRQTLKSIIRSALFCARQNIALRAHREVKQEKESEMSQDVNQGYSEDEDVDEDEKITNEKSN